MTDAPNYNGKYPGAGAIVGPLWQQIWNYMEDGQWHSTTEIKEEFARRGKSEYTVEKLVFKAAKFGALQYMHKTGRRIRPHAEFRRTDPGVIKDA